MRDKPIKLTLGIVALLATASVAANDFSLDWWTIDGGGAMFTTGGDFELSGTIGQPDADVSMVGGGYELTGGFWLGVAPTPEWCLGDMNCSGGPATFADISYFVAALSGEANWIAYYQGIHASAPTCPWLLGDYDDPRNGVDFGDIGPFTNSIGQPCIPYGTTGACCAPDGTCTVTLQANCADEWQGAGTDCDPNPCPPPGEWCLGDMDCSGGTPTFADISYFVAALSGEANWIAYYQSIHGSAPTCPYLLGDFSDPQNGVDFLDITPFANSIGQECVFYGGGT